MLSYSWVPGFQLSISSLRGNFSNSSKQKVKRDMNPPVQELRTIFVNKSQEKSNSYLYQTAPLTPFPGPHLEDQHPGLVPFISSEEDSIPASYLLLQTPGPSCQLVPGILFPVQLFWMVNHSMNVTLLLAEIHPLREHFCAVAAVFPGPGCQVDEEARGDGEWEEELNYQLCSSYHCLQGCS